jgi:hypothetical protein
MDAQGDREHLVPIPEDLTNVYFNLAQCTIGVTFSAAMRARPEAGRDMTERRVGHWPRAAASQTTPACSPWRTKSEKASSCARLPGSSSIKAPIPTFTRGSFHIW